MGTSSIYIHPTAIVDEGATIGPGTKVWHWTHIGSGAVIGENCSFGQNVYVGNAVNIGNNVRVQNNVSIYDGVVLEDDVFCGPSMVFTNVINPRSYVNRKQEYKPTVVKKGASIGANVTIVCGNTVSEYAFIGAGSVVTKDVRAYALMIGNGLAGCAVVGKSFKKNWVPKFAQNAKPNLILLKMTVGS